MKRRDFLVRTAGLVAWTRSGRAQAPQGAPPAPAPARQGGPGRGQGPANVPPEKLARISLMTLNFNTYLKTPWTANPTPEQTLTIFDLPKMYVDMYGVHNIEYQHSHLAPSNPSQGNIDGDPAMFKELKARLDEQNVKMTQINLEFGTQNI
jgi:hypothetical protein